MAEKQIKPKATGTESAKKTTAAAGVQKKSMRKMKRYSKRAIGH